MVFQTLHSLQSALVAWERKYWFAHQNIAAVPAPLSSVLVGISHKIAL